MIPCLKNIFNMQIYDHEYELIPEVELETNINDLPDCLLKKFLKI